MVERASGDFEKRMRSRLCWLAWRTKFGFDKTRVDPEHYDWLTGPGKSQRRGAPGPVTTASTASVYNAGF